MKLLLWISRYIFHHRWLWLSNLTWDWQLAHDAPSLSKDIRLRLRNLGWLNDYYGDEG